ncbi:hypothetical protein N0B16_03510 [Chryseobacterium sp. GMJ5]|uniref:Amine oxidase n=1 Tax=Chryseobacterium gilvum TaxID=2976534 RepID=A0ABT2VU04_9FLAO|nr:hypothetical protein [Chryseobacterium gilvum]MCU7613494.1 hypothetical protein [Chryseobacterium gilvum]
MYSNDYHPLNSNPFSSFLMGGFECADHQNAFGERIDLIALTGHDRMLEGDYEMLADIQIKTVREGIRWSFVEKVPYQYNWKHVEEMILAAQKTGIHIIWDICHFGFPDDLTPLHPMFPRRFAHLCAAFVKLYRSLIPNGDLIITPINEVSFLSWLGGDARGTVPYCVNQGWEVKYCMMKAYIEGVEMMKELDPTVRIMVTEPLINITSNFYSDDLTKLDALAKHHEQFQVADILSGRMCPELRGKEEYLDMVGVNFYYSNQWIYPSHEHIPWREEPPHLLWRPLHSLIEEVFLRYGRPIVISETSHPGEDRSKWLEMIGNECAEILKNGLPVWGCCIYPIIDRPDWDFPEQWHHSGLWDIFDLQTLEREIHMESLQTLIDINEKLYINKKDHTILSL